MYVKVIKLTKEVGDVVDRGVVGLAVLEDISTVVVVWLIDDEEFEKPVTKIQTLNQFQIKHLCSYQDSIF